MFPNELPNCAGDIRLNAENYEQDLAKRVLVDVSDPYNPTAAEVSLPGWRDHSGMENHLLVVQGAPTYENDSNGVECAVFDNTLIAIMKDVLKMGAGTLAISFSGGYVVNGGRDLLTIERYDATKTRTGNASWNLQRYVGSGNNRVSWGVPGQGTKLTLGGSSSGDMAVQRVALSCDMKSAGGGIFLKREGVALVSGTPNENASRTPVGSDIIFGRLNTAQTDAARTAVAGNERMLLSHVQLFGNFQTGNLISSYPTELEELFAGMT